MVSRLIPIFGIPKYSVLTIPFYISQDKSYVEHFAVQCYRRQWRRAVRYRACQLLYPQFVFEYEFGLATGVNSAGGATSERGSMYRSSQDGYLVTGVRHGRGAALPSSDLAPGAVLETSQGL